MERMFLKTKTSPTKQYCGEEDEIQEDIDRFNAKIGDWEGFDCERCKNKGSIAVKDKNGRMAIEPCACRKIRTAKRLIRESGIKNEYLFADFKVEECYQKKMLAKAKTFTDNPTGKWFYMSGQNGIGKTMLCTAIVNELLGKYIPCKYMLWRDVSLRLKALTNNAEEYLAVIKPLKEIEVLYIDDFFKTEQNKEPTPADVNLAFELLNYRYNTKSLITIISCERSLTEVVNIDEAVGSRIYERVGEFNIYVPKDRKKNYRLNGEK